MDAAGPAPRAPRRRRAVAALTAFALALTGAITGALTGVAPPAAAQLYNVMPTDPDGFPTYDFTSADALFVFATSDIRGGRVCIVEASVEDPASASCESPAWGSPNHIVTIGSYFGPIEAPSLIPGTWRLLAENSDYEPTMVSESFTVSPCPGCSRQMGLEAVQRWKDAADASRLGVTLYCIGATVKENAEDALTADTTDIPALASFPISFGYTIGGGFAFGFPDLNPISVMQSKAFEILKNVSCQTQKMYDDIVQDPPDPNYGEIAEPVFRPLDATDFDAPENLELAQAFAQLEGFGVASRVAFERYQGADAANNGTGRVRQLRATSDYSLDLVRAMRTAARELREWAEYADAQESLQSPAFVSTEEADAWRAAVDAVAASGFSADDLAELQALGLSGEQIDNIAASIARVAGTTPRPETIGQTARDLAATLEAAIVDIDAFAREVAAVAETIALTTGPLTAIIAAHPVEGIAPLTVQFDGSGSSPAGEITAYEWSFGDGQASAEISPAHVYAIPGTYTASLTVVASDGASAYATTQITVSPPPNAPPIARNDSASVATGGIVGIHVGANDGDADGYIASIEVVTPPVAGTVECTSPQWCYYTAPTDQVGVDVFTYRITDDDGATAQAWVSVTIVAPVEFVAIDDEYTIARGATWVLLPLANDFSPRGTPRIQSFTDAADGTLTCDVGGTQCTYTADGTGSSDQFSYTAVDPTGDTATATVRIAISDDNQPPQVRFVVDRLETTEGSMFSAGSSFVAADPDGLIVSYSWSVDGEVLGTDRNYVPAPPDDGEYTLELTVTDDLGAAATAGIPLRVANQAPSVGPTEFFTRARLGEAKMFRASAYDPGRFDEPAVYWEFGEGPAEGPFPSDTEVWHTFDEPGTYPVTVWAVDKDGAESSRYSQQVVAIASVVDVGADVVTLQGDVVTFDISGSTPSDSRLWYALDPGDGSGLRSFTNEPTHVYTEPGEYTVRLVQYDRIAPGGAPLEQSDTAGVTVVNVAPTVVGVAHERAVAGEETSFTVFPFDPGGIAGLSYEWDFGEGFRTGSAAVEGVFDEPGTHQVRIRITDPHGGEVVHVETVEVSATATEHGLTSLGRDFWVAFGANYNIDGTAYLALYISGAEGTTGLVTVPGMGAASPFAVPAAGIVRVDVPVEAQAGRSARANQPEIEPHAVHIEADADVSVYGINRIRYSTDAFLALPTSALGDRYRIVDYGAGPPGALTVVAAAGTATIRFTPGSDTDVQPFERTLHMGETLQLEPSSRSLTGSLITSDVPVAVFGGARCANVPGEAGYCDHLTEMLMPTSAWGRSHITVPLATRAADRFRIVADADGTSVELTGGVEETLTLGAGMFYEFVASAPVRIVSSEPVQVAQYSQGSTIDNTISDPFMAIVSPLEQGFTDSTFATPVEGFTDYVNITAPTASRDQVLLDGAPVAAELWRELPAGDGEAYSGAAIAIDPGVHRISSPVPVSTLVYGFGSDDSYGFPGGMRVARIADVQTLALAPAAVSGAIGDELCTVATLTGSQGPVAGARLDVAVTGVVESVFSVVTDASGRANACVDAAAPGEASITVSIGTLSRNATFTWSGPGQHAPVVTIEGALLVVEGGTAQLTAVASDADGDALTYAWDLDGDGEYDDAVDAAVSLPLPVAGAYPVGVRVSDGSAFGTATVEVTATNVVPVVSLPATLTVGRDGAVDLAGSFTDPGADEWTATVDWGDGEAALPLAGKGFALAATLPGPGEYPVTVRVRDLAGGGMGTATVRVSVPANEAPSVEGIDDTSAVEGDTVVFTAEVTDPEGDPVTVSWHVGAAPLGVTLPAVCSVSSSAAVLEVTCTDDAELLVEATVVDAAPPAFAGSFMPETTTVQARLVFENAPPTVAEAVVVAMPGGGGGLARAVVPLSSVFAAPLPAPSPEQPLAVTAAFTDPGTDTFTCGVELTGAAAVELDGVISGGACEVEIASLAAGAYSLTTWVADDDGGIGRSTMTFDVAAVVDPGEPTPTPTVPGPTPTPSVPVATPTPVATPNPNANPTPAPAAVSDPPASGGQSALPATGAGSIDGMLLLALALLALGVLSVSRRRTEGRGRCQASG